MQSKATTVSDYLASLPPDRRTAIEAVRKVILANEAIRRVPAKKYIEVYEKSIGRRA